MSWAFIALARADRLRILAALVLAVVALALAIYGIAGTHPLALACLVPVVLTMIGVFTWPLGERGPRVERNEITGTGFFGERHGGERKDGEP